MSAENTSDLFSSLLSNPAMLSGIAQLLSSSQSAAPEPPQASSVGTDTGASAPKNEDQSQSGGAPDLSGILGAALANPELLSALPKMVETLSGVFSGQGAGTPAPQSDPPASAAGAFGYQSPPPLIPPKSAYPKPARVTDRRSALLLALKPYMSHDKAEMIDTIVRIIEIMSLIK